MGNPIATDTTDDQPQPSSPAMSVGNLLAQVFRRVSVMSPVKIPFTQQEEECLRTLIIQDSDYLKTKRDIEKLLKISKFAGKNLSVVSLRSIR